MFTPVNNEALEVQRETLGDRHPSTLASFNNLGTLLQDKGDLAAAELLFREVLEGRRATLGSWNLDTPISIDNLCMLLIHRRLELTYKYIASSCRSLSLVRMTAVSRRSRAPLFALRLSACTCAEARGIAREKGAGSGRGNRNVSHASCIQLWRLKGRGSHRRPEAGYNGIGP